MLSIVDEGGAPAQLNELQEAAAAIQVANATADSAIAEFGNLLVGADVKIERAREELAEAQEQKGALLRLRNEAHQTRLDAVRPLTALLRAAAPDELLDFITELKWLRHSAEFQLGVGRPVPSERPQSGVFAQERQRQIEEAQAEIDAQLDLIGAFLKRVRKVAPLAEMLIFSADFDAEARVAELRRDIAPIPEIVAKGWAATAKTQLAIGRASP